MGLLTTKKNLNVALGHMRAEIENYCGMLPEHSALSDRLEAGFLSWHKTGQWLESDLPDQALHKEEKQLMIELRQSLNINKKDFKTMGHQFALILIKLLDRIDEADLRMDNGFDQMNASIWKRINEAEEAINALRKTSSSLSAQLIELDTDLSKIEGEKKTENDLEKRNSAIEICLEAHARQITSIENMLNLQSTAINELQEVYSNKSDV